MNRKEETAQRLELYRDEVDRFQQLIEKDELLYHRWMLTNDTGLADSRR